MNYFSRTKKSASYNKRTKLLSISLIISVMAGLVGLAPNASLAVSAAFNVSRVSLDSSNTQANNESAAPSVSSDGRYVAFESWATNLVPGDTNGSPDIFRKDLQTGAIVRVSLDSSNTQANSFSLAPSISSDGRYVAFRSHATNLVTVDTNVAWDVFRKDLQTGAIVRVSVDSSNAQANGNNYYPSISSDGRYVAFYSGATNLVLGDTNGASDIFRKDLQTEAIVRVSVDSSNTQSNNESYAPSISSDGRYVAFESRATNLVTVDTNDAWDIFRKDLQTQDIVRVSANSSSTQADSHSFISSISSDGRYVAFESNATNLVSGDTNGTSDIFRKDLNGGAIVRVSANSSSTQSDSYSSDPSISSDGRYVAFRSRGTNLVLGDTNGSIDIFRKDLQTEAIVRVSVDSSNTQTNDDSDEPSISSDGRYVAFKSNATNLVSGDTNSSDDVFLAYYNNAPVLNPIGNKTANEGQALQFNLVANDLDADALTYSTTSLPAGALLNSITGQFTWTPNHNQAGSYPIHFQVNDSVFNDSEDIAIIVNNVDQPAPQPPVPNPEKTILSTLLSLKASPKSIAVGKAVTIKGQLKDSNGQPVIGKSVTIKQKVIKTTKKKVKGKLKVTKKWIWQVIATVKTNSKGQFIKKIKPKQTTLYQATFSGDTSYSAKSSNIAKVTVIKAAKKKGNK